MDEGLQRLVPIFGELRDRLRRSIVEDFGVYRALLSAP
jgi:hypothetical protein